MKEFELKEKTLEALKRIMEDSAGLARVYWCDDELIIERSSFRSDSLRFSEEGYVSLYTEEDARGTPSLEQLIRLPFRKIDEVLEKQDKKWKESGRKYLQVEAWASEDVKKDAAS